MATIDIQSLPVMERMYWLQTAIAPRPICFASTINKHGEVNLSPFSFFNLFSSNPPVVIFSPSRRGRDNTIKHTLENVLEVPEVAINICNYAMVQQVSLSSCEYPKGVDEFIKAGFTKTAASVIRPPLVAEAPIQLECKVLEVKSLGEQAGAGQLIIAEVLTMHVNNELLLPNGKINTAELDLVARLGGDYYARITKECLFEVPKPNKDLGIGFDALPKAIRNSTVLTGNHLGMLANSTAIPDVNPAFTDERVAHIGHYYSLQPQEMELELHKYAAELLQKNEVEKAWQVLLHMADE
jgi:flavin reductase (DIM6/NTAB) family NADH-FMN oxidoreductase RutF